MENLNKNKPKLFRGIVKIISVFYRKREIDGEENILDEPTIYVGNHAQMHGPITSSLYFPFDGKVWCRGEMMNIKEAPAYAYKDFWSHKPKITKWFYKLLSYCIAPISSYIFTRAETIAVYKDARVISTFKNSVAELQKGKSIVIFPEEATPFNEIINEFQDKFVDVAKLYSRRSKKEISFVPFYNAVELKKVVFGQPIKFNPSIDMEEQRKTICDYLKEEITKMAKELPIHTVVPYDNVKKKNYPKSK
ncbi:MAG: hypothetical protein E7360_00790 [Clostridiales bacterium]|nr:hypothetical protein [Clostridiales bacterium]